MHSERWYEPEDIDDESDGDDFRGRIKSALASDESLLWSARPRLPRMRRIAVIPAMFVIVLTSLSGLALTAMLGILEREELNPLVLIMALCLAPAVLGAFIVFDLSRRVIAWLISRWRLARTIYAVTDQRAIVALAGGAAGELQLFSLLPGMLDGTSRFEYPDGSGDVYFEGLGKPARGLVGFFGIRSVRRVEELVCETLIDPFPHW
jgi:hypothetical protein